MTTINEKAKARETWDLVDQAQDGGPQGQQAFAALYDQYVDTVFRYVFYRCGNKELAEDITADTFLRALRSIGTITWTGADFGSWLVTIARNLLFDHRKRASRVEVPCDILQIMHHTALVDDDDPEISTAKYIGGKIVLEALKKQLNPEQSECLVLRFLMGRTITETASIMGKTEGAVKVLTLRALRSLRKHLIRTGFAESWLGRTAKPPTAFFPLSPDPPQR